MKGFQFLVLLLMGCIFSITGLRQFFIEPLASTSSNLIWFGIQILPLLLVLPGVLALKARSYFFTILVSSLYFVHGVMLAATEPLRTIALWEVFFSVALVCVATYVLRLLNDPATPNA